LTADLYRSLAAHYDRLRMDWYAGSLGPRLVELLRAHGVREGRVLDAGCGTGSLALLFDSCGYQVTGVDLSPALLAEAEAKKVDRPIEFACADITRLDRPERYEAIVSVGDVLNHLMTIEAWREAIRCFARHLKPEGVLFFDSLTARGLAQIDSYEIQDRPDGALIMGIVYEPAARRSTLKLTCYAPVPGTTWFARSSESIPEWAPPVAEVLELLRQEGFDRIERPWSRGDDPEQEERLTLIARARR
jgi:SAM-dependent methyltransferase